MEFGYGVLTLVLFFSSNGCSQAVTKTPIKPINQPINSFGQAHASALRQSKSIHHSVHSKAACPYPDWSICQSVIFPILKFYFYHLILLVLALPSTNSPVS